MCRFTIIAGIAGHAGHASARGGYDGQSTCYYLLVAKMTKKAARGPWWDPTMASFDKWVQAASGSECHPYVYD